VLARVPGLGSRLDSGLRIGPSGFIYGLRTGVKNWTLNGSYMDPGRGLELDLEGIHGFQHGKEPDPTGLKEFFL
jgi:hypothetical protein